MQEFYIEKITRGDFEALLVLFKEFSEYLKLPNKMTNSLERMEREAAFIEGFVAKNTKGKIVGYTTCFLTYHTWSGKSMYMDDLYIREQYRGKGIGRLLIDKVIEYAKINNCYKLRWQVSNWNNSAIFFYQSIGAEIDSVEMNCDLIL